MIINFEDLNPVKSTIVIKEKEYILKPFSIFTHVWAKNQFATVDEPDGMKVLHKRMEDIKDLNSWALLTWYLLEDKTDFPQYPDFLKVIGELGEFNVVIPMYNALVKCIGLSQPNIDDIEEELELKKHKAVGS